MLVTIPSFCVPNVWASVAPILQKAVDKSQEDYTLEDIQNCLLNRSMQLWVWVVEEKIIACCVTMVVCYPQRKVCQLPYIAGVGLKQWLACEDAVIKWAKDNGCTKLEGFDRGGWLRVLKGWYKVWITIRKDI